MKVIINENYNLSCISSARYLCFVFMQGISWLLLPVSLLHAFRLTHADFQPPTGLPTNMPTLTVPTTAPSAWPRVQSWEASVDWAQSAVDPNVVWEDNAVNPNGVWGYGYMAAGDVFWLGAPDTDVLHGDI